MEEILNLLQDNARLALEDIAAMTKKTVEEVYREYCEKGRYNKAYTTKKKQDSLWNNYIAVIAPAVTVFYKSEFINEQFTIYNVQ